MVTQAFYFRTLSSASNLRYQSFWCSPTMVSTKLPCTDNNGAIAKKMVLEILWVVEIMNSARLCVSFDSLSIQLQKMPRHQVDSYFKCMSAGWNDIGSTKLNTAFLEWYWLLSNKLQMNSTSVYRQCQCSTPRWVVVRSEIVAGMIIFRANYQMRFSQRGMSPQACSSYLGACGRFCECHYDGLVGKGASMCQWRH